MEEERKEGGRKGQSRDGQREIKGLLSGIDQRGHRLG